MAQHNYWQIAAGFFGRDYHKDFIRYGMAFVGGENQIRTMRKVGVDDRIILKQGKTKFWAVGQVVERNGRHRGEGDKDWLKDFDGWNLPAYCFVDWHVPDHHSAQPAKGLALGAIMRVNKQELRNMAECILSSVAVEEKYDPEPEPTRLVGDQTILEFLIRQGLRPGAAEELTATFNRIRLLAGYYYGLDKRQDLREHEIRTFLVIPLLLALGWAEQQIKIELPVKDRGRADIACFSKPYTGEKENDRCLLIIETKSFTQGLDYAPKQVKKYAEYFPNCKVVVVTNGYCYKAFRKGKEDATFAETPSAYLNLLKPRDRYPLDPNVEGCLEALKLLLPVSYE